MQYVVFVIEMRGWRVGDVGGNNILIQFVYSIWLNKSKKKNNFTLLIQTAAYTRIFFFSMAGGCLMRAFNGVPVETQTCATEINLSIL